MLNSALGLGLLIGAYSISSDHETYRGKVIENNSSQYRNVQGELVFDNSVVIQLENGDEKLFKNFDGPVEDEYGHIKNKRNSRQLQGFLKEGKEVEIETNGWNLSTLGMYENISKAK